jgi:ubiquinone/menaquinone biosynthesis C-methylase UbiE
METINCKFQVTDARNLPFRDNYFALDTLEYIKDDVDTTIKEIHRVLMPYVLAILSWPTESWFYKFRRSLLFYQLEKKFKLHEPTSR